MGIELYQKMEMLRRNLINISLEFLTRILLRRCSNALRVEIKIGKMNYGQWRAEYNYAINKYIYWYSKLLRPIWVKMWHNYQKNTPCTLQTCKTQKTEWNVRWIVNCVHQKQSRMEHYVRWRKTMKSDAEGNG